MTAQDAIREVIAALPVARDLAWYEGANAVLDADAGARCPPRPYVVVDAPSTDTDTGAKNWPGRTVDVAVRIYTDTSGDIDADDIGHAIRDALHRSTVAWDGMIGTLNVSGPSVSPADASMVGRILRIRVLSFATVAP